MSRAESPVTVETSAVVYSLDTAKVKPQNWIWPGYIPRGGITLLFGDPSAGKTTTGCNLIARYTSGQSWPDGQPNGKPGSVLVMTGEDSFERTIKPRLVAAGADCRKVTIWDRIRTKISDGTIDERLPDLAADVDHLRAIVEGAPDLGLVLIDTLSCFLGVKDSNQQSQVRRALLPLHDLCDQTGLSLLCIGHMNKGSGGKAQYRASGSLAYIAAARSALLCAPDRDDPDCAVMAIAKCNLAQKSPSLRYRIVSCDENPEVATVEWYGASDYSADQLLEEKKPATKTEAIIEWLQDVLKDGPMHSGTVEALADEAGFKKRTLWEARGVAKDRGILRCNKIGFGDGAHWEWELCRLS
ncbi:MAG TPA: AAA family ATPase [Phycisphaerae bacterium]|nr:AAA family ATPase [Phycisphaerae bacterium]